MTDSTRAAFEAWRKTCADGHSLLDTWRAARQSALEEAAKVCDERAIDHAGFTECEWEAQQCAEAIRQLAAQADKRQGEWDA